MKLDDIQSVIEDVRVGKPVVIVDDKDRENEGDLMVAAEKTTPEIINFMLRDGKGLICLSLSPDRLQNLGIPMQVTENTSLFGTNFTVSIDHVSVVGRGVTAESRAKTILAAVEEGASREQFVVPGYVFPLRAVPGGVLKRRGQTEASVDLARLAGLKHAGVVCEIMSADGEMLRGETLQRYCTDYNLKLTSVDAVARYRLEHVSLRRVAESEIKGIKRLNVHGADSVGSYTLTGPLKVIVYQDDVDDEEHLAFVRGTPVNGAPVRIHSECLTGDVFSSRRCDCGVQLNQALEYIDQNGAGVVVYLHQEGRGIGLGNKLRAYELQDQGMDTVEANLQLGFAADLRNYRAGAQILADLGLTAVRLITNNPEKMRQLSTFGIDVLERIPLTTSVDEHNVEYLRTKRERLGHIVNI